jgi:SAM-dependent methyltransferase
MTATSRTNAPPPTCRHCKAPLTRTLVDLGLSPLANSYLKPGDSDAPEPKYPLHARVCDQCLLVQVDDVVPAEAIFSHDYAYFSSFSESWLTHCSDYADAITQSRGLGPQSLVIEIASNDGYLLQFFRAKGIEVLGVEPAANVAAAAEQKGIPTRVAFFGKALAEELRAEGKAPALVCAANVLAHVPDINDFVAGIATLLSGEAVFTVEFPHLLKLIEGVQFDTIYHEHYSYLSLIAVERIFASQGLRVIDVECLPTHGGSLRVHACLHEAALPANRKAVEQVREQERQAGLDTPAGYAGFQERVDATRDGLLRYLRAAKSEGRRVVGYGAAAKGNTLLNYCGVGSDLIDYVVDLNPAKQHTLLPGSRIPVYPVEALWEKIPDDILILPWNIRNEVVSQLSELRERGVRFSIAVPTVEFIG